MSRQAGRTDGSAAVGTPVVHLSFDVEDWFQVENLREFFPPGTWDERELRVEANTRRLLELLERRELRATFFVLGWIAERFPGLVREIAESGHEIASHGYGHILNHDLSEQQQREDLRRSKALLEDIAGRPVVGYRAPTFSISTGLLDILAESGYAYDSSYNDFASNPRYGSLETGAVSNCSASFVVESGIREFPMPVLRVGKVKLPISGGGYFRLIPLPIFERMVDGFLRRYERYVFYLHPWEVDPGQPRVKGLRPGYRFRHYYNLSRCQAKLERFLDYVLRRGWLVRTLASALGGGEHETTPERKGQ